jgi:hypothetical protein
MAKVVGLELHWLPKDLGSLFIKGQTINSIEFWYKAIIEKNK